MAGPTKRNPMSQHATNPGYIDSEAATREVRMIEG
jgi:hypothetical protein